MGEYILISTGIGIACSQPFPSYSQAREQMIKEVSDNLLVMSKTSCLVSSWHIGQYDASIEAIDLHWYIEYLRGE